MTLTIAEMPSHRHPIKAASGTGNTSAPAGTVLASPSTGAIYSTQAPDVELQSKATTSVGQGQPHENMPPYLGMNFIISLFGIYPSQG